MAKLADVPFATQEGAAGVTQNSLETLHNLYAEITVSGRAQIIRRQRAGLTSIYAIAGEKRCIEKFGPLHYCIIADTFYSFDGTTVTTLGTLSTSVGRCTMVTNNNAQIMISDGQSLYFWNGLMLAAVTNPAAFMPGNLSYLDGFAIVNEAGTDRFYISGANDFSAIDALDFATAESNPDPLQTTFVDHNDVWLIGSTTTEIWQDTGGTDFPLQPITTAKIERGTAAPYSVAADDNTVINLGNDLIVYRYEGYRPLRISTHAIEEAIKACTAAGIAAAYALIYSMAGHKFYTLTIPGELTVQYNFATQLWNRANTYGSNSWDIIGSNGHYTDYVLTATGIAQLDTTVNTDEGGVMVRLARSSPGWAGGRRITLSEFYVDCEVGNARAGITPQLSLRVAPDGVSFGNYRPRSLGAAGQLKTRPVWRNNGQGRKPVFELSTSDDFRLTIMGTLLNASVGSS